MKVLNIEEIVKCPNYADKSEDCTEACHRCGLEFNKYFSAIKETFNKAVYECREGNFDVARRMFQEIKVMFPEAAEKADVYLKKIDDQVAILNAEKSASKPQEDPVKEKPENNPAIGYVKPPGLRPQPRAPIAQATPAVSIMSGVAWIVLMVGIVGALVVFLSGMSWPAAGIGFAILLCSVMVWAVITVVSEISMNVHQTRTNSDFMIQNYQKYD